MNSQLFDAIDYLEEEKGIDKDILMEALEAALISAYKKNFKSASNVRVDIDEESASLKVFSRKTVVDEVENNLEEISLDEAREIDPNYEADDVIEVEVTPKTWTNCGPGSQTSCYAARPRGRARCDFQ